MFFGVHNVECRGSGGGAKDSLNIINQFYAPLYVEMQEISALSTYYIQEKFFSEKTAICHRSIR